MNANATEPPIALGLFTRAQDYAAQLRKDGLSPKTPLKRDATIVVFCQTFFQQFFEAALGYELTGVDATAKADAVGLRVKTHGLAPETVALVRSFEDLCDMWPDVLGFTYGGLSTEFRRFHTEYIPRLLGRITAWAKIAGHPDVERAAAAASSDWDQLATQL